MAKNNTAPVTEKNVGGIALPEGFADLGLDRFFYKPELCKDRPLVGYLMSVEEFGREEADKDKHWDALVVHTTQPTLVVTKDAEGKETTMEVGAGEDVMIAITDKLEKLRPFALDPELMAEFFIQPIDKLILETDAKGNVKRSLWRYKAGGKQPVPRPQGAAWARPALPAKSNGAQLPG